MDQDSQKIPPVANSRNGKATVESEEPWSFNTQASFIRDGTIAPLAKVIYLALRSYVGPGSPEPFPSLATLSKHTGTTIKAIQRHLKELETHGLICRSFVRDSGKWHATRYTLKPHKPKGKKAHRRAKMTTGQKRPSSITHSVPSNSTGLKLVRKTPAAESPTSRKPDLNEIYHPAGCICLECRKQREAVDF